MRREKGPREGACTCDKEETRAGFVTKVHACPPPPPRLPIPAATPLWGQMPGQASNPGVARAPGGSEDAFAGGGSLAGAGGGGGGGVVGAARGGRVQGAGGVWVGAGGAGRGMQYSPAQGGAGGGGMGVMTEDEYNRLVSSFGVEGGGGSLRERQVERQALGVARWSSPPSDARTATARYARYIVRVWRRNAVHGSQLLPPRYTTICVPALPVHALPCQPIPLASTPCTLHCCCCGCCCCCYSVSYPSYSSYNYPATCGLLTKNLLQHSVSTVAAPLGLAPRPDSLDSRDPASPIPPFHSRQLHAHLHRRRNSRSGGTG
jgi:hypothetical protein